MPTAASTLRSPELTIKSVGFRSICKAENDRLGTRIIDQPAVFYNNQKKKKKKKKKHLLHTQMIHEHTHTTLIELCNGRAKRHRWILIGLMCCTPFSPLDVFTPLGCFFLLLSFRATKRLHRPRAVTVATTPFSCPFFCCSYRCCRPVMDGMAIVLFSRVLLRSFLH